jgi:hypothetical protein
MRFHIAFFAALFAIRAGSQIVGLPACSQTCIGSFGGCSLSDVNCICSNKPLIDELACCVSKKCDADDQAGELSLLPAERKCACAYGLELMNLFSVAVITFANLICKGSKVTDLPQTATCTAEAGRSGNATLSSTRTSSPNATGTAVVTSASIASPVQTGAASMHGLEGLGLVVALAGVLWSV